MSTSISLSLTALLALSLPSIRRHLFWFTGKTSWCKLITKSQELPQTTAQEIELEVFHAKVSTKKHVVFYQFLTRFNMFHPNAPMDPSPDPSYLPSTYPPIPSWIPGTSIKAFHDALQLLHFWSLDGRRHEIHRLDNPKKKQGDSSDVTAKPSLKLTASSSHPEFWGPPPAKGGSELGNHHFLGAKW